MRPEPNLPFSLALHVNPAGLEGESHSIPSSMPSAVESTRPDVKRNTGLALFNPANTQKILRLPISGIQIAYYCGVQCSKEQKRKLLRSRDIL